MNTTPDHRPSPGPWDKHTLWRRRDEGGFLVEVSHTDRCGQNHWALYAYIYAGHPLFTRFDGEGLWQPATNALPLHGGCTFLQAFRNNESTIVSWKVGCDYSHLHDECYGMLSPDYAPDGQVFRDADILAACLTAMAGQAAATGATP